MLRLIAKLSFFTLTIFFFISILSTLFFFQWITVAVTFLILPVLLFNYLVLNPISIKEKKIKNFEIYKPGLNDSDVLILISSERINEASKKDNFYENDWSLTWINTVEKVIGQSSIVDITEFSEKDTKRRIIVLSQSVGSELTDEQVKMLESFIIEGGAIISELPSNKLFSLTGIKPNNNVKKAEKIEWVNTNYLTNEVSSIINSMPLNTFIYCTSEIQENVEMLMKIDSYPAICRCFIGKGVVISILFNFCLEMVSLKQGLPNLPNYKMKKRINLKFQGLMTSDLSSTTSIGDNSIPYADILEGILFNIISFSHPLPGWWYYPAYYQSALIDSIDEDYEAKKIVKHFNKKEIKNPKKTIFLVADSPPKKECVNKLIEKNFEIGIHWNRFLFHINKQGFHWNKIKTFFEQMKALERIVPQNYKILISRIHFLKWDEDYTNTFKVMATCGIKMDSSYGPGRGQKGYLFNTGFPFYPLDKNGHIIKIYELPFQIHLPHGSGNKEFYKKLIMDSYSHWNTTIVILSHFSSLREKILSTEGFLSDDVEESKIWLTGFYDYLKHWENRKINILKSEYKDCKLKIFVKCKEDGLTLYLPNTNNIERYILDGKDVESFEANDKKLIRIPKGAHIIEAYYKLLNKANTITNLPSS